jgi:hypothetical protein
LKIPAEQLCEMGYRDLKLHPVAGKCGVFAETDINGLQKQGVPPDELMASLFESIIQQNMSVLTRGHTLRPTVLLLGGPNCYIKGMRDCWRENIPAMWKERGVKLPDPDKAPEDYIITPDNAQYFAAIGAVEFAKTELDEDANAGLYLGREMLNWYIAHGRAAEKAAAGRADSLAMPRNWLHSRTAIASSRGRPRSTPPKKWWKRSSGWTAGRPRPRRCWSIARGT